MAGAPQGNQNAAKAKVWSAAILRALDRRKPADERIQAIDELADKLLDKCATGDLAALQELGNRLEGKPAQAIIGGDDDDPPVRIQKVERVIVRANSKSADG
jgi:hypothetical protein